MVLAGTCWYYGNLWYLVGTMNYTGTTLWYFDGTDENKLKIPVAIVWYCAILNESEGDNMKYNRTTAMYEEQTFHKGDVMRMDGIGAFADCLIVGFGEMNEGTPIATGTLYAKLARPYAYVSKYGNSVWTVVEDIEFVSLKSLAKHYQRVGTGRLN